MCGIVGYVGTDDCASFLVSGLRKLEYRGYDSAGVAVLHEGRLSITRSQGKLIQLERRLIAEPLPGHIGIGHTRWATHGKPSDQNAHPHSYGGVAVVHNGIIENHLELRSHLRARGHVFSSETDTEIFAHLIADAVAAGSVDLMSAVRASLTVVRGTYALAVVSEAFPREIVATKHASPLVVGIGAGENYIASDVPALLEKTRDVIFLEDGDMVRLTREGVQLFGTDGTTLQRPARRIDWTPMMAEKGGHKHFMHKEIHEQPRALIDTIRGRTGADESSGALDGVTLSAEAAQRLERIVIVACGTSYHAGLVGKHYLESIARVPVEIDLASEYRYRDPLVDHRTLCIAVSQSGETADTLAALREAKSKGARSLAICNVLGSAITREATDTLYTHAGPEIGVASTKCFTTQLSAFLVLATHLGRLRGAVSMERAHEILSSLRQVPALLEDVLKREAQILEAARRFASARHMLFLGRGLNAPVALEGALKLKEISYIHAEGYAAGEMKHGPIALVDDQLPVVAIATRDLGGVADTYEKMLGNMEEVRARSGRLIAVVTEGDTTAATLADAILEVPAAPALLQPMVNVLPLQLFAYHVADQRGTDVDQPRNLAKSVTVE